MADIDPTTLSIADFPGFSTFVLASLHHDLPSSNESRAASCGDDTCCCLVPTPPICPECGGNG